MKKILILSSIVCVIVSSCVSKLQTAITGTWGAEECYINGESVMNNMYANIYHFDKDGKCGMPIFNFSNKNKKGKWFLQTNGDTLVSIELEDSPMKGKFKVRFEKDYDRKVLFMILENDSIYLKGAKAFYNFDTGKTGVFQ